jgi:hypothetical protein
LENSWMNLPRAISSDCTSISNQRSERSTTATQNCFCSRSPRILIFFFVLFFVATLV